MTRIIKILVFAILTLTFFPISLQAQECDRACLESFVDRYLDAVTDNNPDAIPIASDVRFTENGQRLNLRDGLWQTMKGKGEYKIIIADVPAQQVAFLGNIFEDHRDPLQSTGVLLSLRLRIEEGEISEIEHFLARSASAAERISALEVRPAFTSALTDSQRMSRRDLLEVANMYFTGMQKNDGLMDYPFADDCDRRENGMQSTNAPTPEGEARPDPSDATGYSSQWTCMEQFQSGLIFFVNRIRDRRFVAVDEERGLVFSFVFFDHSGGEFRHGVTPNGREVVAGPVQPWTWGIAEIFKVYDGQIHEIEAILERVPYGMNSGWSTWEQGMSDELQDVTFSDE
ncbi:MAG: hypothetical protein HOH14_12285 [Gammaproteobacteria bacterium]|jgi:hypothetical protein|nr:hypothetical protein [Gammaproteobacteria bacterium]MBT6044257.1 hypothetical protein [Gammaproteobacteria bacterium]